MWNQELNWFQENNDILAKSCIDKFYEGWQACHAFYLPTKVNIFTFVGKYVCAVEKGVNDNARARGVVMHAANYVSNSFIQNNKRLGRSLGCPAVPVELSKDIINTIKDKSCFFIYHPSRASKFGTKSIS